MSQIPLTSRLRVYVAGPFSGNKEANTLRAIEAGHALMDAGLSPFIPHLFFYMEQTKQRPYEDWMQQDLAFLEVCHALLRLPGPSPGADRETVHAAALGIPVFETEPALLEWWQPFRDLPDGLREAWLRGQIAWSGKHLEDREPVASLRPGMSVSDLIVQQRR